MILFVKRYTMKTILTISGICLVMSLLGLLTLSTMSVAPGGEAWRGGLLSAHALFFAGWLALALWAKRRVRVEHGASSPGLAFRAEARAPRGMARNYSYRKASIGSRLAAFRAGKKPKTTPMIVLTEKAIITDSGEIRVGNPANLVSRGASQ